MCNYEAKSPLFMIKTAGLYHVPIKSYSKNTHPPFILKWILIRSSLAFFSKDRSLQALQEYVFRISFEYILSSV